MTQNCDGQEKDRRVLGGRLQPFQQMVILPPVAIKYILKDAVYNPIVC